MPIEVGYEIEKIVQEDDWRAPNLPIGSTIVGKVIEVDEPFCTIEWETGIEEKLLIEVIEA